MSGITVTDLTATPSPSIQAARDSSVSAAAGQELVAELGAVAAMPGFQRIREPDPVQPPGDILRRDEGNAGHQMPLATMALASWSMPSAGSPAMLMRPVPTM